MECGISNKSWGISHTRIIKIKKECSMPMSQDGENYPLRIIARNLILGTEYSPCGLQEGRVEKRVVDFTYLR